jgi:hypothetical protein
MHLAVVFSPRRLALALWVVIYLRLHVERSMAIYNYVNWTLLSYRESLNDNV